MKSPDKLALVTGGTKGIGLEFSRRLTRMGYRVVATFRSDEDSANRAAQEMKKSLSVVRSDVSDPDDVARLADLVRTGHGTPHVLVNNAGLNIDRPVLEISDTDWRQVLDTNLSGPFYMTRAFAPHMLEAGGGSIVNIGATTAIRPRLNGANYCSSKAGLLHLTKCLAMELAPTIRVNCLIPGMIDTEEMRTRFRTAEPEHLNSLLDEIPQRRIGSTEEMADALEFLVGAGAAYVTGQKLIVDGGQFMW
ncbi:MULTISPECIES: SDR family NAD(P)-dependent oxidoreductase [unclassified Streptomyces]|uniref:SDR family NAD(P)-dependent oxidoreductase n=1 Tax=unclassified Streptomyces TaxID=2593676 RepID=UPI001BE942EB|nr:MULTISPECIES: SDR family oxidoreductase [unclassified Streptomyces]MBT2407044.1 SDR family oxidoreductase [Streptomyces sp. ISL-21]MBT2454588.1 SDR family oxidoreductase [Streptomyces sp. ISL-86]MBT2611795.1 SDR family oxidoreductase [Streptomyces sp. ISL-87]